MLVPGRMLMFAHRAEISIIANVVTSVPFLITGLGGLRYLARMRRRTGVMPGTPFVAFVLSLVLIGAGSIFYHWTPSPERLLWDRLPIAICLAAFACTIVDIGHSSGVGGALLSPALIVATSSVLYWYESWSLGHEDLRPYGVVQVLTAALAVFSAFNWSPRFLSIPALRVPLTIYAAGRICELFQQKIYDRTGLDLGHALKHLLVALAVFLIVRSVGDASEHQERERCKPNMALGKLTERRG